jgi:deoxyribose-phosphate aldolase
VILETTLLSRDEIIDASILADVACAGFVKTSTGFANGGATVRYVHLIFVPLSLLNNSIVLSD